MRISWHRPWPAEVPLHMHTWPPHPSPPFVPALSPWSKPSHLPLPQFQNVFWLLHWPACLFSPSFSIKLHTIHALGVEGCLVLDLAALQISNFGGQQRLDGICTSSTLVIRFQALLSFLSTKKRVVENPNRIDPVQRDLRLWQLRAAAPWRWQTSFSSFFSSFSSHPRLAGSPCPPFPQLAGAAPVRFRSCPSCLTKQVHKRINDRVSAAFSALQASEGVRHKGVSALEYG